MKATLTLEIEGSKEEIDSIAKRIQNIIEYKESTPTVKIKASGFNPPRTRNNDMKSWGNKVAKRSRKMW